LGDRERVEVEAVSPEFAAFLRGLVRPNQ
jgi:hypothetical protein